METVDLQKIGRFLKLRVDSEEEKQLCKEPQGRCFSALAHFLEVMQH
jgi:hypothetical protein